MIILCVYLGCLKPPKNCDEYLILILLKKIIDMFRILCLGENRNKSCKNWSESSNVTYSKPRKIIFKVRIL